MNGLTGWRALTTSYQRICRVDHRTIRQHFHVVMSKRFTPYGHSAVRGIVHAPARWLRVFMAVIILAISGPVAASHAATTDFTTMAESLVLADGSSAGHDAGTQNNPDESSGKHHAHCAVCHSPASASVRVQDSVSVPDGDPITYGLIDTSDVAKHDPSPLPEPPRA